MIARLPESLRAALGADAVDERGAAWAVRGVTPQCAVRPASEEQAGEALRVLREANAAVVVWGGGTQIDVGAPPARYDCALSLARLDRVLEHAPADLTATVQAGATLTQTQAALRAAGQRIAIDAPWAARSTLGGLHASGTVGPRTQDLGTLRTMVVGAEAYTADGTLFRAGGRVVKNVSGYDVHRVLFRSWGSLAVLTRLHVRLAALPECEHATIARFAGAAQAFAAADRVRLASVRPVAVAIVRGLAPAADGVCVVAGWEGSASDVEDARAAARPAWDPALGCEERAGDDAGALWASVSAAQIADPLAAAARVRLAVPPARLAAVWDACAGHRASAGLLAYADRGVLTVHLTGERAAESAAACRHAALDAGGAAIVLSDAACTPDAVWGPPTAHQALLQRTKAAFDPRGVLAPGRLPGGL